jgi:rhodanese-related sulfurtransferase
MATRRTLLAALGGLPAFALPALAQPRWPAAVDEHVAAVRRGIATVDLEGFAAIVANPAGALLLDVREADELAQGRIPGTLHLPRGLLEFRIWTVLGFPGPVDTARRIVLHCATGNRATLAAKQLGDVGFTAVVAAVMEFAAWQRAGLPLIR